jgi:hypothetical protein
LKIPFSSALLLAAGKGWRYSQGAVQLLTEYHQRFPWVAQLLTDSEGIGTPNVATVFPDLGEAELAAQVSAIHRWHSSSVLSGRTLVAVDAESLPADVMSKVVSAFLAWLHRSPTAVVLENVAPAQLLPPAVGVAPGLRAAVAAECVELGDIVVVISGEGVEERLPPFGTLAVVVGVHEGFVELIAEKTFEGGSDLEGKLAQRRGARVPLHVLLNLTRLSPKLGWSPGGTKRPSLGGSSAAGTSALVATAPAAVSVRGPNGGRGFQDAAGRGRRARVGDDAEGRPPDPAHVLATMRSATSATKNQQVSQPQQQKKQLAAEARSMLAAAIGAQGQRGAVPGGDEAGVGSRGGDLGDGELSSARKGLLGALELVVEVAGGTAELPRDQRRALEVCLVLHVCVVVAS